MPTYLPTKDVLNVSVSCFKNYDTPTNPVTISLLTWLRSSKHRAKVEALRQIDDKDQRDDMKATLPAITPSGVFSYRQESSLIPGSHTRLIQFDIDLKDNPRIRNYADLKEQIACLPFVTYCALSASGKGYWGLIPIAYPERHSQHFDALKRVFAHYRINIDTKPRNVASLRGYAYDTTPYIPEQVMLFELYDEPPKPKKRQLDFTPDADTDRARVEVCIQEVLQRDTYIGDNYEEWYEVGCSLANTFGESGIDYYHHISQNYPTYQPARTDSQYAACLKGRSSATLGTFFHLCQRQGINWKDLMPAREAKPQPQAKKPNPEIDTLRTTTRSKIVTTIVDQLANPGSILKPDESQLERLIVEPCDTFSTEWDEPNPPEAKPIIRPKTFHEWQCEHKDFSKLGLTSLSKTSCKRIA